MPDLIAAVVVPLAANAVGGAINKLQVAVVSWFVLGFVLGARQRLRPVLCAGVAGLASGLQAFGPQVSPDLEAAQGIAFWFGAACFVLTYVGTFCAALVRTRNR